MAHSQPTTGKKCVHQPVNSEKFCMQCGAINPYFSMETFREDVGAEAVFGADCDNGHADLKKAVEETPEYPYCTECGWKAPVPEPEQAAVETQPRI